MASERRALVLPETAGVGDRVRIARVVARLTRKEMARALGLSLKTYDRIEAGERELRLSDLNALCAITGQDVAFFGASSDEGPPSGPRALPASQVPNGDEDEA